MFGTGHSFRLVGSHKRALIKLEGAAHSSFASSFLPSSLSLSFSSLYLLPHLFHTLWRLFYRSTVGSFRSRFYYSSTHLPFHFPSSLIPRQHRQYHPYRHYSVVHCPRNRFLPPKRLGCPARTAKNAKATFPEQFFAGLGAAAAQVSVLSSSSSVFLPSSSFPLLPPLLASFFAFNLAFLV